VNDENYRSGGDFTLEFVGLRYGFNRRDFSERVVSAARRLGLVGDEPLASSAIADLVELTARGGVAAPRSVLGAHLDALREPGPGARDVVYWLRKLVFRSAWLDQRVKSGVVEAVFDDADGGFRYLANGYEVPPSQDDDVPSLAEHRLPGA
jgi:hypothetical protein